jgi:3-phosphoshikimate 1-carboxyvinyltransferase
VPQAAAAFAGAARRTAIARTMSAMSSTVVTPARTAARGTFGVPGDKSIGHRALLLGAIARGTTTIRGFSGGADNRATPAACQALGVPVTPQGSELRVEGGGWDGLRAPVATIDCANSGTTMRLLAGVLAGRPFASRLDGDASLRRRPMRRVLTPLGAMGAMIASEGADHRRRSRSPAGRCAGPRTCCRSRARR